MNTLYINSSDLQTDLCSIGAKHNTDKSPFAKNSACCSHRKGYTALYSLLLSQYESLAFNLAEIGIEQSASLLTWNEKYPLAKICMFDVDEQKLNKGRELNVPNSFFYKIDVGNPLSIKESFQQSNKIFDIIIDDSSHLIPHQNNIIQNCHNYLKTGGILIIEDIERNIPFEAFAVNKETWAFSTFIICDHSNRICSDNDKILFLVKK